MKTISTILFGLLLLALPVTASAQADLTDLTEMFKVFQEARNVTAGYDLTTQAFVQPVPDDYPLGPGDTLLVMAGGVVPDVVMLQIDPQGKLMVYPAGPVDINGMTVAEARQKIEDELAYYIKEPRVEVQLALTRKIEVYLSGQVMLPGMYITWAGIKPIGFLQNASGLVETPVPGSNIDERNYLSPILRILNSSASRRIDIMRNGRVIGEMDLLSVLYGGAAEAGMTLEDGDVIYVPEIKRPVIVRGGVVRPGKYEFNDDEDLRDVLLLAGGADSGQFLSHVTVERETDSGNQKVKVPVDLNYNPVDDNFQLRPGDIIRVPEMANYVYVIGGVFLPQAVDYHEDWRVIDYVGHTGGITAPSDYATTSLIKHAGTPEAVTIKVNLKDLLKGNAVENPVVEPGDVIIVPFKNRAWTGPGVTNTILQFATFARFLWG